MELEMLKQDPNDLCIAIQIWQFFIMKQMKKRI